MGVLVGLLFCACSDPSGVALHDASPFDDAKQTDSALDSGAADGAGLCSQVIDFKGIHTHINGKTGPRTFELPVDARSFVISVKGDADVMFNLAEVTLANGISLVPKAWVSLAGQPVACVSQCTNRVVAQPGAAAFLFPNTPLAKLAPGPVKFRVIAFKKNPKGHYPPAIAKLDIRVHLVCKKANTAPATLALNIGLTGAGGLQVDTALKDPRLSKAMATVGSIYAKAGITIAPVRVFKAAEIPFIAQQTGDKAEFTVLLRSGKLAEMGVNVMLVDKIVATGSTGPGQALLAGVSGGIPGPPLEVGGDRSGIAVALHLGAGQQDALGHTIAHELGHFLGLFHTVEVPPSGGKSIKDNINDTGDANTNLMHWSVGEEATELTSDQRFVLHGSPWLVPALD